MSIIGTGFGLRQRAQEGMSAVAKLEAQENQQRMALEQARQAQQMQMYGTFGGIGASVGTPKAIEAYKLAKPAGSEAVNQLVQTQANNNAIVQGGLQTKLDAALSSQIPSGAGGAGVGGATGAGAGSGVVGGATTTGAQVAGGTKAAADAATTVKAAQDAANVVEAAETVKTASDVANAANTVSTAGSTGSALMSGVGALAAPVAIGLGVAFLLNKLFD